MPSFRTIIFFGADSSGKEEMISAFSHVPFVNVFATKDREELTQILKQSEQAAVFVREIEDVGEIYDIDLETQDKLCFCTFFLDEEGLISKEQIKLFSLQRVSTLRSVPLSELVNWISFLFLGKIVPAHFEGNRPPAVIQRNQKRKSYFSHFKFQRDRWELIASTHFQDPEIERRFGESWSHFCQGITEMAHTLTKASEDMDFSSDYSLIIYLHPGKTPSSLSIVNIRKGLGTYKEQRDQAIAFLKKL